MTIEEFLKLINRSEENIKDIDIFNKFINLSNNGTDEEKKYYSKYLAHLSRIVTRYDELNDKTKFDFESIIKQETKNYYDNIFKKVEDNNTKALIVSIEESNDTILDLSQLLASIKCALIKDLSDYDNIVKDIKNSVIKNINERNQDKIKAQEIKLNKEQDLKNTDLDNYIYNSINEFKEQIGLNDLAINNVKVGEKDATTFTFKGKADVTEHEGHFFYAYCYNEKLYNFMHNKSLQILKKTANLDHEITLNEALTVLPKAIESFNKFRNGFFNKFNSYIHENVGTIATLNGEYINSKENVLEEVLDYSLGYNISDFKKAICYKFNIPANYNYVENNIIPNDKNTWKDIRLNAYNNITNTINNSNINELTIVEKKETVLNLLLNIRNDYNTIKQMRDQRHWWHYIFDHKNYVAEKEAISNMYASLEQKNISKDYASRILNKSNEQLKELANVSNKINTIFNENKVVNNDLLANNLKDELSNDKVINKENVIDNNVNINREFNKN